MPTARLTNLNYEMDFLASALAVGFGRPRGHIGHYLLPVYAQPSIGKHIVRAPKHGAESFNLVTETEHALRTDPNEVSFQLDYIDETLIRHALQMILDPDEIEAGALAGVGVREVAWRQVVDQYELAREYATAQLLQTTGTYAAGHSATATTGWNTQTTPPQSDIDPVLDLTTRMEVVRNATGRSPDLIGMGVDAWNAFKNNSYVIDRMPGGTGADRTKKLVPTPAEAAEWLTLDSERTDPPRIIVGEATYRDEVAQTFTKMWGDNVVMAITSKDVANEPGPYFGTTLAEQFAEVDGIPMTGAAGMWEESPWKVHIFYGGWYKLWITMNTAAYLLLDVVK